MYPLERKEPFTHRDTVHRSMGLLEETQVRTEMKWIACFGYTGHRYLIDTEQVPAL